jgi:hypothetical protein
MLLPQIADEQRSSPHRGAIAQVARVSVQDGGEQRIDNPFGRTRSSRTGGIGETRLQGPELALEEAADPVVYTLATDAQALGNLGHRHPLIEPE